MYFNTCAWKIYIHHHHLTGSMSQITKPKSISWRNVSHFMVKILYNHNIVYICDSKSLTIGLCCLHLGFIYSFFGSISCSSGATFFFFKIEEKKLDYRLHYRSWLSNLNKWKMLLLCSIYVSSLLIALYIYYIVDANGFLTVFIKMWQKHGTSIFSGSHMCSRHIQHTTESFPVEVCLDCRSN